MSPNDSIGMPVAAWIISECLLNWAGRWGAVEAEQVGHRLRDAILTSAEAEGLTYQCYWLSTAIALGGIMRVCPRPCLVSNPLDSARCSGV